MSKKDGTPGTSGIEYIKFAASGRNRFVTLIALLAALGGFLFGYDTGIIGQALPFVQKQFHADTLTSSWIVASVLIGAIIGAATSGTWPTGSAGSGPGSSPGRAGAPEPAIIRPSPEAGGAASQASPAETGSSTGSHPCAPESRDVVIMRREETWQFPRTCCAHPRPAAPPAWPGTG